MDTLTPEARRWQTCVHEAGHAAAALLLGVEGVGAVVFDEGGGLATPTPETAKPAAAADYEPPKLDAAYRFDSWPALLRDATFTAAGCAAVDLLLHAEKLETTVENYDGEMVRAAARAAIGLCCDPMAEMFFSLLAAARARTLLKPVLWRVKRVAKELDRRGRMTCEQIVEAMYPEHANRPRKETAPRPRESSAAAHAAENAPSPS